MHRSIETASIVLSLIRSMHLEIIRQREINLDHNLSLDNFWFNFNHVDKPKHKIVSIVNLTGIPKETVRRKIKKLVQNNYVVLHRGKNFYWNLP